MNEYKQSLLNMPCTCPHSDPLYWEPSGFYDRYHDEDCAKIIAQKELKRIENE